jgi:hypothetical protein
MVSNTGAHNQHLLNPAEREFFSADLDGVGGPRAVLDRRPAVTAPVAAQLGAPPPTAAGSGDRVANRSADVGAVR